MSWVWVDKRVVLAVHVEQAAEHGGGGGIRDEGLLASALARPVDKAGYAECDIADLAAANAFGLVGNHPFVDGNKRTGFVVMELFLVLNGWELIADDASCLEMFLSLAESDLSEQELAHWLRENTRPAPV